MIGEFKRHFQARFYEVMDSFLKFEFKNIHSNVIWMRGFDEFSGFVTALHVS